MSLTPGAVINMSGSLTNPKFIRTALIGHTVEANASNKLMVNILDWYCPAPAPGGTLATFNTNIQGAIATDYLGVLSNTYTWDVTQSKYLDNPLAIPTTLTVGTAGSIITDRAASFNAATIQKKTTVPSRNFRGAMHIGALPESFTTTDELNVTGLAAYGSLDGALQATVGAGVSDGVNTFFPIIVSTTLSNLFASPAVVTFAPITSFETNPYLGTMKRRKQKTSV